MANITKSFNFRNGVQVDDDNLLVNPSGLVGIGTTVPTEALDVRGDCVVSGLVSSTTAKFTDLEVTNLTTGTNNLAIGIDKIIGAGVSIRSGIISANTAQTGVVTYYGDGGKLNNIPTSQWKDLNIGLGFTSIYNEGFVGIVTGDPRFALQISGSNDLSNFIDGVGITSEGGIVATGIVTAGVLDSTYIIGNVTSGISTLGISTADSLSVAGIVTAGIGFTGDVRGNIVSGISTIIQVDSTNVSVSGVVTATTFKGDVEGGVTGDVTGNLTGHVAGNIVGLAATINGPLSVSGSITGTTEVNTVRLISSSSTLGISTASKLNITEKIGVGIQNPANNVDIYSLGDTKTLIAGSDTASLLISQRTVTGIGESVSAIRFGATSKSLEIINGDTGDFSSIIHGGGFSGINTGSFKWVYGRTNAELMQLSYDGKLGIGKVPETTLDVVGVATFSSSVRVDGSLTVNGSIFGNGSGISNLTLPSVANGTNINATTGISTVNELDVAKTIGVATVAIGTAREHVETGIDIDAQNSTALLLRVGIGSTQPGTTLDVKGGLFGNMPGNVSTETLVVGKTLTSCAVDFSNAGKDLAGVSANRYYMLPPKITTSDRNNIPSGNLQAGALIYNTSTNKVQVYNGSSWVDLH